MAKDMPRSFAWLSIWRRVIRICMKAVTSITAMTPAMVSRAGATSTGA